MLTTQAQGSAGCFNFSDKIVKSLKEPIAPGKNHENIIQSGELSIKPEGTYWAAVRGEVASPIGEILKLLLDPQTTLSHSVSEMNVHDFPLAGFHDDHYLAHKKIHQVVKPFLFIKVEWDTDWSFARLEGSADKPKKILVAYEKTAGTSHIEHLCGNILLQDLGKDQTDIFQYEEVKATRRSEKDTVQGLLGTLQTLREKIKK